MFNYIFSALPQCQTTVSFTLVYCSPPWLIVLMLYILYSIGPCSHYEPTVFMLSDSLAVLAPTFPFCFVTVSFVSDQTLMQSRNNSYREKIRAAEMVLITQSVCFHKKWNLVRPLLKKKYLSSYESHKHIFRYLKRLRSDYILRKRGWWIYSIICW